MVKPKGWISTRLPVEMYKLFGVNENHARWTTSDKAGWGLVAVGPPGQVGRQLWYGLPQFGCATAGPGCAFAGGIGHFIICAIIALTIIRALKYHPPPNMFDNLFTKLLSNDGYGTGGTSFTTTKKAPGLKSVVPESC